MKAPQFIAGCEAVAQVLADGLANPLEVRGKLAELEAARRELFGDRAEWGGWRIEERDGAELVTLRDGVAGKYWDGWIFGPLSPADEAELRTMFAAVLRSWAGRAREWQETERKRGRPDDQDVSKVRDFIAKNCMDIRDRGAIQAALEQAGLGHVTAKEISRRKSEIIKAREAGKFR